MNHGFHSGDPRRAERLTLFDELPESQRAQAKEAFARYIDLALRIFARLEQDPEAYAQFETLTDLVYRPTIREERPAHQPSSLNRNE